MPENMKVHARFKQLVLVLSYEGTNYHGIQYAGANVPSEQFCASPGRPRPRVGAPTSCRRDCRVSAALPPAATPRRASALW